MGQRSDVPEIGSSTVYAIYAMPKVISYLVRIMLDPGKMWRDPCALVKSGLCEQPNRTTAQSGAPRLNGKKERRMEVRLTIVEARVPSDDTQMTLISSAIAL